VERRRETTKGTKAFSPSSKAQQGVRLLSVPLASCQSKGIGSTVSSPPDPWSWLGLAGLTNAQAHVPTLNTGLELAESTLSGLYAYMGQPTEEPQAMDSVWPSVTDEQKRKLGITPVLLDFVQNIADHPSTFTDFPIDTAEGPQPAKSIDAESFKLTRRQARHAKAILSMVPKLQKLRHDLVPKYLIEDVFWQVYFLLITSKTKDLDWECDEELSDEEGEDEEHQSEQSEEAAEQESQRRKVMKIKLRREMIVGYDDDSDDDGGGGRSPPTAQQASTHISLLKLREVWKVHKDGYMLKMKQNSAYLEDASRLEKLWDRQIFSGNEPGHLVREQFQHLIRPGIAPSHRTMLWPLLTDALLMMKKKPSLYEEMLQDVYITEEAEKKLPRGEGQASAQEDGGREEKKESSAEESKVETVIPDSKILPDLRLPTAFSRIPTFCGKLVTISHSLNSEGIVAAKRLLTVFAIENPEWSYIPCLPDLVLLLLHFMAEPAVYFTVLSMMEKPIPLLPSEPDQKPRQERLSLNKDGPSKKIRLINRNQQEVDMSVCTLIDSLLPQHMESLSTHLNGPCREVMVNGDFRREIQEWMNRLFVGLLPLSTVFKIIDNMLVEGVTTLYKITLHILKANEESLLTAENGQKFMENLYSIAERYAESGLDDSFLFNNPSPFTGIEANMILRAESKAEAANPQLQAVQEPMISVFHVPVVKKPSPIISQEQFEVIWQWLPSRYQVKDPVAHFTSSNDGFSVLSIFRQCKNSAPHIFLIKTKQGRIFGAYLNDGWKPSQKFYGSGECFLFTLHPLTRKFAWRPPNKELFMIGNEKELIIGGGDGCGIWLDSELWHGASEYCETFRNPPINGKKDFEAIAIEIYGFS